MSVSERIVQNKVKAPKSKRLHLFLPDFLEAPQVNAAQSAQVN